MWQCRMIHTVTVMGLHTVYVIVCTGTMYRCHTSTRSINRGGGVCGSVGVIHTVTVMGLHTVTVMGLHTVYVIVCTGTCFPILDII